MADFSKWLGLEMTCVNLSNDLTFQSLFMHGIYEGYSAALKKSDITLLLGESFDTTNQGFWVAVITIQTKDGRTYKYFSTSPSRESARKWAQEQALKGQPELFKEFLPSEPEFTTWLNADMRRLMGSPLEEYTGMINSHKYHNIFLREEFDGSDWKAVVAIRRRAFHEPVVSGVGEDPNRNRARDTAVGSLQKDFQELSSVAQSILT